jgi:hypothetical protein
MRAVTVYRRENDGISSYPTRHPIGSVFELRIYERGNNCNDLLRLARRLFALDTADDIHLLIGVGQGRATNLPEPNRDCTVG